MPIKELILGIEAESRYTIALYQWIAVGSAITRTTLGTVSRTWLFTTIIMTEKGKTDMQRINHRLAIAAILAATTLSTHSTNATPLNTTNATLSASARESGEDLPDPNPTGDGEFPDILALMINDGAFIEQPEVAVELLTGVLESQTNSPTGVFAGFIAAFAFNGQIQEDSQPGLNLLAQDFIAAFLNPDPSMGYQVRFTNTLNVPAVLAVNLPSDINPQITFTDGATTNAFVHAEVFDTGGDPGATADVNVDFFTIQNGVGNVATSFFFEESLVDGVAQTLDQPATTPTFLDTITGFQTGVLATVSPGDTLELRTNFSLGSDSIPLVDRLVLDNALTQGVQAVANSLVPEPTTAAITTTLLLALITPNRRAFKGVGSHC